MKLIKRLLGKINNCIQNDKGLTITEMLATVLILLLISGGMATGVMVAERQYAKAMRQSEAEELYMSLENIITNELRYTTKLKYEKGTASGEVQGLFSVTYALKADYYAELVPLNKEGIPADYGELAFKYGDEYNRVLGGQAYPDGLTASADIKYDESNRKFQVDLKIYSEGQPIIKDKLFTVKALNIVETTY